MDINNSLFKIRMLYSLHIYWQLNVSVLYIVDMVDQAITHGGIKKGMTIIDTYY